MKMLVAMLIICIALVSCDFVVYQSEVDKTDEGISTEPLSLFTNPESGEMLNDDEVAIANKCNQVFQAIRSCDPDEYRNLVSAGVLSGTLYTGRRQSDFAVYSVPENIDVDEDGTLFLYSQDNLNQAAILTTWTLMQSYSQDELEIVFLPDDFELTFDWNSMSAEDFQEQFGNVHSCFSEMMELSRGGTSTVFVKDDTYYLTDATYAYVSDADLLEFHGSFVVFQVNESKVDLLALLIIVP